MWIHRENGAIQSVYAVQQPGYADEELPDDNPEVLAFVNAPFIAFQNAETQKANAAQTTLRAREDAIALAERLIASGQQDDINKALLNLFKGQS